MPSLPFVLATLLASTAHGQESDSLAIQSVFVAPFYSEDPTLEAEAERLSGVVADALAREVVLFGVADVAPFEDYDASTYLKACPPGRYLGCVYVLGARGMGDWAVGAEVEQGMTGPSVTVSYIDVEQAKSVFAFSVEIDADNEPAFLAGVAQSMQWLMDGAGQATDLRGEIDDAREAWLEGRLEAEDAAAALVGLQEELGAMLEVDRLDLEAPKLSAEDLQKYIEDDAMTPWDRLGMSQTQYLRYRNSGKHLEDWRLLAAGRLRSIILRAGGGFASGPYDHVFDGRYVLDLTNGVWSEVEVDVFQELVSGTSGVGELELGFGVHPMLEIAGLVSFRSGSYSYFQHQEVVGDNNTLLLEPDSTAMSSFRVGGRVTLVPMPTFAARPSLGVAVSAWSGVQVTDVWEVPEFIPAQPKPTLVVLTASPGGEVTLSRQLIFYARFNAELALGKRLWTYHEGDQLLVNPGTPQGSSPIGMGVTAGVAIKLGPIGGVPQAPTAIEDEWEPE